MLLFVSASTLHPILWGPHGDCVASGGDNLRVWLWSARAGWAVAGLLCLPADVWQISVAMPVSSPAALHPVVCVALRADSITSAGTDSDYFGRH